VEKSASFLVEITFLGTPVTDANQYSALVTILTANFVAREIPVICTEF
jgi:hypothetical protein